MKESLSAGLNPLSQYFNPYYYLIISNLHLKFLSLIFIFNSKSIIISPIFYYLILSMMNLIPLNIDL